MLIKSEDMNTDPPEWLVEGMIPRVGVGFGYGKSYWGKSLLFDGELALAVANGVKFLERDTIQGTAVVVLGEGAYDAGVRKQARLMREQQDREAFAAGLGEDAGKAWLAAQPTYNGKKLKFWNSPFSVPVTRADGEGELTNSVQQFITAMKQFKDLELVVLDALGDFTGGLSIVNDTSANRFMLGAKEIVRQLECCVLIIAHPTAKGDKMLGADRLFNAADFVIRIEPDERNAPGMPQTASIVCEKNKYGPKFEPDGYVIEPCEWWDPVFDENDDPTGEMVKIRSATVRRRDETPVPDMRPVPIEADTSFDLVNVPSGNPAKRSMYGVGRPRGDRSKRITEFVNANPDGVNAATVIAALGDELGLNDANARVYLNRLVTRGDIARVGAGLFGPVQE